MTRKALFHNLTIRAICHSTENEEKVQSAMRKVSGRSSIERAETVGYFKNKLVIFEARLTRSHEIHDLWTSLDENIMSKVREQLEERVDDRCIFHMRFDKQEAYKGRIVLGCLGDTIAFTGKVVAYPPRKDIAIKHLLESLTQ